MVVGTVAVWVWDLFLETVATVLLLPLLVIDFFLPVDGGLAGDLLLNG